MKKYLIIFTAFIFLAGVLYFILNTNNDYAKVDNTEPVPVSFSGRVSTVSTSSEEVLMTVKTVPNNYTKYLYLSLPMPVDCSTKVSLEDIMEVVKNAYVTVTGTEYGNGKVTLCDEENESEFAIDSLPALDISSDLESEKSARENVMFYLSRENPDATYVAIKEIKEEFWQDSCLGLGGVGDICDIVEVKGFRIVGEVDGQEIFLRTNHSGELIIRE